MGGCNSERCLKWGSEGSLTVLSQKKKLKEGDG